jgi:endonuclease/exonuclease/phosphatase family metal-dependent hydrolase
MKPARIFKKTMHDAIHKPTCELVLTLLAMWLILICCIGEAEAKTFKIASYNVENLFDLIKSGTEYMEYIPDTGYGWNESAFQIKISNIAEVIKEMDAEVMALQEIESENALISLRDKLKTLQLNYPYYEIVGPKETAVTCAILSKFPIIEKNEIHVDGEFSRNILEVTLDIDGRRLVFFVNHWKSRRGPESMRIAYAKALKKRIDELGDDADFIVIGDLNSDYREWQVFRDSPRLNDTDGITGINHVLKTIIDDHLVDESTLISQTGNEYLYNLWLEVDGRRRWSHNFFGDKNSLDSIIVSRALYDGRGISYLDNSFDKFDPDYLFNANAIYRWQRAKGGKGKHVGEGYSDHLPIYASFSTDPFRLKARDAYVEKIPELELETKRISDLYACNIGKVNYLLKSCAVIYKDMDNATIKQGGDRAIFVYTAGRMLQYGKVYDVTVTELYDYFGLREITSIGGIREVGQLDNLAPHLLDGLSADLSDPAVQNEVISELEGVYKRGYLYYGNSRKIKLYTKDKKLRPPNNARVVLRHVRIGCHRYPEIVIEKNGQIAKPVAGQDGACRKDSHTRLERCSVGNGSEDRP